MRSPEFIRFLSRSASFETALSIEDCFSPFILLPTLWDSFSRLCSRQAPFSLRMTSWVLKLHYISYCHSERESGGFDDESHECEFLRLRTPGGLHIPQHSGSVRVGGPFFLSRKSCDHLLLPIVDIDA